MKLRGIAISLFAAALSFTAAAQVKLSEFKEMTDSLSVLAEERTTIKTKLSLKKVSPRGNLMDFYFKSTIGDLIWRKGDIEWLQDRINELMPASYGRYSAGRIWSENTPLERLITPELSYDGHPRDSKYRKEAEKHVPLVRRIGEQDFPEGLSGRHIALWQSHGRYFNEQEGVWTWQRPRLFTTAEDALTQSFVLPFLIPMLENAGACVMTPRERDIQTNEVICDNDPSFAGDRSENIRKLGRYEEQGTWTIAGSGFADPKAFYTGNDNPFTMGTSRQARIVSGKGGLSVAKWTPDIPQRGQYAVYVSYRSVEKSTDAAHYTVHHLGGKTEFAVNQRMGGGTWIYLGTFEFGEGTGGCVTLDNDTPDGLHTKGNIVTADAVRFGGGIGKIARGPEGEEILSGLPAYLEGALYSMQWAGVDTTVTRAHAAEYTNDFASRGPWTAYMSGGSSVNPKAEGKGIPFDLSFAWHTDAGVTPNDSIVGTLAIYTLKADGKTLYPGGGSRMAAREYSDIVQTQICNDIRTQFEPEWRRREIWDRNYSESRTPSAPAMLLELLSHQNFADMKLGLDPAFRFTAARSVYKGMLKFLSNRYGFSYTVQPLPVRSLAVLPVDRNTAELSWIPVSDTLEPTAVPEGYIVYTRIDDGAFDNGVDIGSLTVTDGRVRTSVEIQPGHIYSYKVAAYNRGGQSFPSEVLCTGTPLEIRGEPVIIINNFDRVSAPAWFDTPEYAGFDIRLDSGCGYIRDISYIGEQFQFRRDLPWIDDYNPGFGASFDDMAGRIVPGNTFDFVIMHGKAIMALGHPFYSASSSAFAENTSIADNAWAADLLCGKQVTTSYGRGGVPDRFQVFPATLQAALRTYTSKGGNIIISGARIGTDAWDRVFPAIKTDVDSLAVTQKFIKEVFGYRWSTSYGSNGCEVKYKKNRLIGADGLDKPFSFHNEINDHIYKVDTPDGLMPSGPGARTFLTYSDTGMSAGVCFEGKGHRTVSIGFPIETLRDPKDMENIFKASFGFFNK